MLLLCSCSVFVEGDATVTRAGVEVRHADAQEFILSLFAKPKDLSLEK